MIKRLFYVTSNHTLAFALAMLWGLMNNAFVAVSNPLVLKYLFDEGIIKGNFKFFVIFGIAAILVFTIWRLSTLGYSLYTQKLKNRIMEDLTLKMLDIYHRIPYGEIIKKGDGYFVSRVYEDVNSASQSITGAVMNMINACAMFIASFAVIILLSWQLTVITVIITPGLYYLSIRFSSKIQSRSKQEQEEEAKLREVVTRIVRSYKSTRVFELYETVFKAFSSQFTRFIDILYSRSRSSDVYRTLSNIFMSWVEVAVIILGGYEVLIGRMTFGGFMGFLNAFWMATGGLRQLIESVPQLSMLMASIERLKEFERYSSEFFVRPCYSEGGVMLQNVYFAYDDKPVVEGFTLRLERGERILIVGPNGSGKTTLANIICGLLTPQKGAIALPERVSAIVEPVFLPPAPLRELIPKGKKAEAIRLIERFGLKDHLDKDPEELSAGQRKKFNVIMALLKDAQCYVFDEPLANVDVESKKGLMDAIFERTKGRTLIAIMHGDNEFYNMFDRVIYLHPARENPINC